MPRLRQLQMRRRLPLASLWVVDLYHAQSRASAISGVDAPTPTNRPQAALRIYGGAEIAARRGHRREDLPSVRRHAERLDRIEVSNVRARAIAFAIHTTDRVQNAPRLVGRDAHPAPRSRHRRRLGPGCAARQVEGKDRRHVVIHAPGVLAIVRVDHASQRVKLAAEDGGPEVAHGLWQIRHGAPALSLDVVGQRRAQDGGAVEARDDEDVGAVHASFVAHTLGGHRRSGGPPRCAGAGERCRKLVERGHH
mmetsp:Transcript_101322/g.309852  ORF Transcript_101322/g.309852 Transcript_101322/m.309852 type:complete len:251 (-) Transcript_101322:143-895(-)